MKRNGTESASMEAQLVPSMESLVPDTEDSSESLFDTSTPSDTSLFGASQILLNTAVGSGAIMIPYCFTTGICLELLISLSFATLSFLSMWFLIEAARASRRYDYQGLFDRCFGERYRWVLDVLIAPMQFGTLIIYAHWTGRLICQVIKSYVDTPIPLIKTDAFWILATTMGIVFPLTLFRTISKLDGVSAFSVFFVIMLTIHSTYRLILDVEQGKFQADKLKYFAFDNWKIVITSFSVNALAYTCHVNLFAVCASMERCTVTRARILGVIVVVGAYLCYNLFGLITYVDRPVDLLHTPTSLELYYPTKDVFTIITTLGIVVLLLGSSPLILWPLRNVVNHLVWKDAPVSTWKWALVGCLGVLLPAILASLSDDVITFFDVVGGLFTPTITFFLPALFYLICVKGRSRFMTYLAWQHMVFTVIGAASATWQAINNVMHPARKR
jgi:amino acid permease